MPWNEPGGGNKDPWSQKPSNNQGPPDLDEMLRKLTARFGGIFGNKGASGSGGGKKFSNTGLWLLVGVLVLAWLASGIYIVRAGEAAVVLRFGAYQSVTTPGPHWHIPYPVEEINMVNVTEIRSTQHKATMLTQDENIVDVQLAAQYMVKSPEEYVFEVRLPDVTLRQAMESAVRDVVGKSTMDYILAEGRAEVAEETMTLMQMILDQYKTGLLVTTVNMQQAQPPDEVQDAFADAIKAREDEVRFKNEAEAYSNGIIPQARGEAARIEQQANAYKDRVIARAEGEAARFGKLLGEYVKAPEVTRKRLYLDSVESVLSNSSKVVMDVKNSNNLLYLPVDKLMTQGAAAAIAQSNTGATQGMSGNSTNTQQNNRQSRPQLREGR